MMIAFQYDLSYYSIEIYDRIRFYMPIKYFLLASYIYPQQFLCYPKPLYKINMICGWSAHPSDKELGDIDSEEVSSLAMVNIYLLSRWVIYLLNSLKVF